jgi:hypothetical protein
MDYPRFGLIRQIFPDDPAPSPRQAVLAELERSGLLDPVRAGQTVIITAGSRGISSMPEVLTTLAGAIAARKAVPILLPAMGSHGGGAIRGQVHVLTSMGLTSETTGARILDSLEMIRIGEVREDVPVLVERAAAEADHVILVNRVKEHTEYIGPTESGLLKMAVVGLGRPEGARIMHQLAVNITYAEAIASIARVILDRLPILGGIAILEDHRNRLRRLECVPAGNIFRREPELLEESKIHKPKLPFDRLDVLLVDEIGKDISGSGMDTKVVGRIMNIYEKECTTPCITRIVVRDLSRRSDGNATGIGLADFITRRALNKVDSDATALNCITAVAPEKARMPVALPHDREALDAAFASIGLWTPEKVRAAWIANTRDLEWLAVSGALFEESRHHAGLAIHGSLFTLPFRPPGELPFLADLIPSDHRDSKGRTR